MSIIRKGQEYESCQPTHVLDGTETHTRIKVVGEPEGTRGMWGYGTVDVVTIEADGREVRPRALAAKELHATGETKTGQPRKTGYRLVKDA